MCDSNKEIHTRQNGTDKSPHDNSKLSKKTHKKWGERKGKSNKKEQDDSPGESKAASVGVLTISAPRARRTSTWWIQNKNSNP